MASVWTSRLGQKLFQLTPCFKALLYPTIWLKDRGSWKIFRGPIQLQKSYIYPPPFNTTRHQYIHQRLAENSGKMLWKREIELTLSLSAWPASVLVLACVSTWFRDVQVERTPESLASLKLQHRLGVLWEDLKSRLVNGAPEQRSIVTQSSQPKYKRSSTESESALLFVLKRETVRKRACNPVTCFVFRSTTKF